MEKLSMEIPEKMKKQNKILLFLSALLFTLKDICMWRIIYQLLTLCELFRCTDFPHTVMAISCIKPEKSFHLF